MAHAHGRRTGRTSEGQQGRRSTGDSAKAANGPYAGILRLQRTAGNIAVSRLAGEKRPTIQRHSSWEHVLLGDTPPGKLGDATVTAEARKHVLYKEWQRAIFFQNDPARDPRSAFPEVRWVQLKGSGLWVSYGELNALADYLPGPDVYDTLSKAELVPVLQRMRSGVREKAGGEFGLRGKAMAGMSTSWLDFVSDAAGEVKALDNATEQLGTDRYTGLVARNACHFAPFSWQRWAHHHTEARAAALAHNQSRKDTVPVKDIPKDAEDHLRTAWLTNGYGDHFLQDSFAAGHLANKTLVMQWWLDYLNANDRRFNDPAPHLRGTRGAPGPPVSGLPDDDVRRRMGSREQPGVAGRELYNTPITDVGSAGGDRELGDTVTDPQTAQERESYSGRVAGSGVDGSGFVGESYEDARQRNYQAYLRFLNSAVLQAGAGAAHDYLNERGLTVTNKRGDTMWIGGDDTLLSKSGPVGARIAGEASELSRKAIEEILDKGETEISVEQIFELVPTSVVVDDAKGGFRTVGLENWQDEVLHQLCLTTIFPELLHSTKLSIIGDFSPEMVEGGISGDAGKAAPPPAKGDFPAPAGADLPA
ncbi:hypothetical protein [Flindersiella endophytica]